MTYLQTIFFDIPGYEGFYSISRTGIIKSFPTDKWHKSRIRKHSTNNWGKYPTVILSKKGVKRTEFVHRLIARTFIPNIDNLKEVNHKDGDVNNFSIENLEWVTHQQNIQHGFDTRTIIPVFNLGSKNPNSVLKEADIPKIRKLRTEGKTYEEIANMFKTKSSNIASIITNNTWKHVK